MKKKIFLVALMLFLLFRPGGSTALAGNIDPGKDGHKYAYGESIGWIDFAPSTGPGMTVTESDITGNAWGENVGWLIMNPTYGGVINDGFGNLSGCAWNENTGWVNFSCETTDCDTVAYGVSIDPDTGVFSGQAWGENIGWVSFDYTGSETYGVKTFWGHSSQCGNGDLEYPEICDDGNLIDGDGCSATCETETIAEVTTEVVDNGDGTYDYTFVEDNTSNPVIEIEENDGLIDLAGFNFNYEAQGNNVGVSITNLNLAPGETKSILLPTSSILCALDTDDFYAWNVAGILDFCLNSSNRIVWSSATGNSCESTGATSVIAKDANGDDVSEYTCEEVEIEGETYAKMSGFTHTTVIGDGLSDPDVDDDGDSYTENGGDCNDDDDEIYPGATEIPGDGIDQDCNGSDLPLTTGCFISNLW